MIKKPNVNVDILIVKDKKILLGLLTEKWKYEGKQVWGVPGRDIRFGEKISETVKRNIKEEFGCEISRLEIISINANYALGNHYIGIGVIVEITGELKTLIPEDWEKWEWFSEEQIPKNLFPPAKNVIDCYLNKKINISD
ncbi:MAG: NUDIX domain-containing protein [Nanoarchaeota archaeon]|nr:NUDIX domain-containing protein [Nanoarchaeota archaeon]MBU1444701.1 NUDIX domain-containing protein [Nanoarchaeota archaeon]MBU2420553.1 NUDIX domain-containing protein [Nanoarchaeota archaeon]MBU2475776.1 NUDIX domain-containing protein [Nanoarchaeota archaeon]MBU3940364.1 NUDIX domain-containing protein [Nanoarchaeota archaeon]